MVDPSPIPESETQLEAKASLRKDMRARRREHVAALSPATRALVLMRPPAPVVPLIPEGACVGVYHATGDEAPARGWARWLAENGRRLALPHFARRDAAMDFRLWNNPWDDDALVPAPWGGFQPGDDAEAVVPDVVVVPLIAFTAEGARLGQGGGHYDRWLTAHPTVTTIGLAWDCQLLDHIPTEPHDRALDAVITPTRFYQGARHAQ